MSDHTAKRATIPEAEDFRLECQSLFDLLVAMPDTLWNEPTAFKGWTSYDVVGHLYMFDRAAAVALNGADAFTAFNAGFHLAKERKISATAYTRSWLGEPSGAVLLQRWRTHADVLADLYRDLDPRQRIPWGRGPTMSARSCISARQMETWAHGQAVFDLLGVERQEHDRIRNIVVIGVNTYEWTFLNRGLSPPCERPHVKLTAPSGEAWSWDGHAGSDLLAGSAVEFCQVVTQTRNVADTGLAMRGEAAQAWMRFAQCFAGPPQTPPAPGLRRLNEHPIVEGFSS